MNKTKIDLRLKQSQVPLQGKITDAMRSLSESTVGAALIVGAGGQLAGILTDGDIRRALLKGATLEAPLEPHINRNFTAVGPSAGRAEVLDLMQARQLSQVPVLDSGGAVVGLHLLRELLGRAKRSNWAVIMAGGKGTRLQPLTENLPKPMLKVAGRPILERLVLHVVGYGIEQIYLAINYMGPTIQEHFKDGARFGCRITYLREKEALGSGGALALLPEKPREPLLVLNGDLVTQVDLGRMFAFHEAGGFVATLGARRYTHQVPFGCLATEGERVKGLEEKPVLERQINAGVYVLSPQLLPRVPARFYPITDLFEDCLARGEAVGAFEIEDDWIDVGQREQLKQARGILK